MSSGLQGVIEESLLLPSSMPLVNITTALDTGGGIWVDYDAVAGISQFFAELPDADDDTTPVELYTTPASALVYFEEWMKNEQLESSPDIPLGEDDTLDDVLERGGLWHSFLSALPVDGCKQLAELACVIQAGKIAKLATLAFSDKLVSLSETQIASLLNIDPEDMITTSDREMIAEYGLSLTPPPLDLPWLTE